MRVLLFVKSGFDALAICTPVQAMVALMVDHLHYLSKGPGQSARVTPRVSSWKFTLEDVYHHLQKSQRCPKVLVVRS